MPPDARKTRTETLSLRLDPKVKFALDFMSRVRGQSITSLVERSIRDLGNREVLEERDDNSNVIEWRWNDLWDPSEGFRTLRLLGVSTYPTTFEEDALRRFTLDHHEFFYRDSDGLHPDRDFVEVLWPHRDELLEMWRTTKGTSRWETGEHMAVLIRGAGLTPPEWPRKPKSKPSGRRGDLDDEIPF